MFGGDDEDGDFLSPTGGAKLASLFGMDQEASQGNDSFQYTAPKQPRKNSAAAPVAPKPSPPAGAPAVLFATAVQTFRYINGQYMKQGKLGAAVLGNHATKEYKLFLYLSQQKQVTTAKIHVGFVFTLQPNNYCTFYDDQRQNWSMMFESEKASSDFCKEVCLAKANSAPSLDAVVLQDLSVGEGQAVENGDSLEVLYTGWLLQNNVIGQMFDSNQNKDKLLRLKLGAGKVIKGWEEGLLGMKKSSRRLIIIPPSLAYGAMGVPNLVPANSTLIFEAELRRVKFSKDGGSDHASAGSRDSAAPSPAPSPAPSVENVAQEPPVQTTTSGEPTLRAKSNSLSEQLANPDMTKAKLISRMAKMGQPMLPFLTGAASQPESSDSELEDTSGSRAKDWAMAPSPVHLSTAPPAPAHTLPHPHTALPSALVPVVGTVASQPGPPSSRNAFQPYTYTETSVAPSPLQPAGQVYPSQTAPYMGSSDVTSFLMTEARQHNTEIRLSIGKVVDKVDQLASKIDDLQRRGTVSMGVSSMSMETSMIMHNIQRIVQENECLKKEVFEKSSRIEEQNRKIGELIDQNQRFVEQSNLLLEKRNDSLKLSSEHSQTRLLQAEQDKHTQPQDLGSGQVRLTEDLASSTARLSQLQLEASVHQQKAMDLQAKLSSALQSNESQSQSIASLEAQLAEVKEAAERCQAQYRSEKQKRKEMELRVKNMEEESQDLKTDKESLERTLLERKKKWKAERQRHDEEIEELRRSSQQEQENLRAQLRKVRTSTDQNASEQMSQLQAELEEEWKGKCKQMLASATEQHNREVAEITEQRDTLYNQLTQLQEASRHSEEQNELQHCRLTEELLTLQEKYIDLQQQGTAVKEKLEQTVAELEMRLAERENSGDTVAEVKRVMNGVFHSLRGEFDLSETYSGQTVLGVIVTTIKNVTLQLLTGTDRPSLRPGTDEEEEEEDKSDDVKQRQETSNQNVNGEREEESVAESDSHRVDEVEEEEVEETVTELVPQKQEEESDLHANNAEHREAECLVQQEQPEGSVVETSAEETSSPVDPKKETSESSQCEGQQETVSEQNAAVSTEVEKVCIEDGMPVGENNATCPKAFGPPPNPPPPPNPIQNSSEMGTRLTKGEGEEKTEEPLFQVKSTTKSPSAPSGEEDEEELSLKGCPPPTPLFGDEEDDDDLDWMK